MAKTQGDKIHDASPHRRQQAREKGQVAFSQDLGSAILLVISAGLLMGLGGRAVDFFASLMAAGAIPGTIMKATSLLDNPWSCAHERAKKK